MYRKIHTTSTACKVAASFLRINPNSWIHTYNTLRMITMHLTVKITKTFKVFGIFCKLFNYAAYTTDDWNFCQWEWQEGK
jgi:hypothetical protein